MSKKWDVIAKPVGLGGGARTEFVPKNDTGLRAVPVLQYVPLLPYSFVVIRKTMNNAPMSVIAPNPGDWTAPAASGVAVPEVSGWR